jgi:hypothetical protein
MLNLLILAVKDFQILFLVAGIVSSFLLLAGLYKPYAMLWWRDVQTRRMVIKFYGGIAIVCFIVYSLLRFAFL